MRRSRCAWGRWPIAVQSEDAPEDVLLGVKGSGQALYVGAGASGYLVASEALRVGRRHPPVRPGGRAAAGTSTTQPAIAVNEPMPATIAAAHSASTTATGVNPALVAAAVGHAGEAGQQIRAYHRRSSGRGGVSG